MKTRAKHGRSIPLPAWMAKGEPEGVARLHDWLCPMIYNSTDNCWHESTGNVRWIPECQRIVAVNGFRRYWRDVCKTVELRSRDERGLLLKEIIKYMVFQGGLVPTETPSARRKKRRRILKRALTRVKRNDVIRARRIMYSDGALFHAARHQSDDALRSAIEAVDSRLLRGEELARLESGPAAPIGVQPGRPDAQALLLERSLRMLFLQWAGRSCDELVNRGRQIAMGANDPFADRQTTPSQRFRGSNSVK